VQFQFLHFAVCQIKFLALDSLTLRLLFAVDIQTHIYLFLEIFPVRLCLSHEWPDSASFMHKLKYISIDFFNELEVWNANIATRKTKSKTQEWRVLN